MRYLLLYIFLFGLLSGCAFKVGYSGRGRDSGKICFPCIDLGYSITIGFFGDEEYWAAYFFRRE